MSSSQISEEVKTRVRTQAKNQCRHAARSPKTICLDEQRYAKGTLRERAVDFSGMRWRQLHG